MPRIEDDPRAPGGLRPPKNGLTLVYGMTDRLKDIRYCIAQYHEAGLDAFQVEVSLQTIPRIATYRHADLANTPILHFDRLGSDLFRDVVNRLAGFAKEEGQPFPFPEKPRAYHLAEIIRYRPHLLGRLHDDPDFRGIRMFVHPVPQPAGEHGFFRRLILFSSQAVEAIRALHPARPTVLLPDRIA